MAKKLPKRRQPVTIYGNIFWYKPIPLGIYIWFAAKKSAVDRVKLRMADLEAWVPVKKKNIKDEGHSVVEAFGCTIFNDRILANGNGSFVCKLNNDDQPGLKKVAIIDPRSHRFVRRKGVKRLAPISKTGVPTPHKSHRMTKWRTEPASLHGGTSRFFACRKCTKCDGEQMSHPAGCFSDLCLTRTCGS